MSYRLYWTIFGLTGQVIGSLDGELRRSIGSEKLAE
jgi:hypothetical protein